MAYFSAIPPSTQVGGSTNLKQDHEEENSADHRLIEWVWQADSENVQRKGLERHRDPAIAREQNNAHGAE